MPIPRLSRSRPPQKEQSKAVTIPAPIGGLNSSDVGFGMPSSDAIQLVNLIPTEFGLRARSGVKFVANLYAGGGIAGQEPTFPALNHTPIGTLFGYHGSSPTWDRIFVFQNIGITYLTATDTSSSPLQAIFPDATGDAGIGCATSFTTIAHHYMAYTDEQNGYYVWEEGGGYPTKVAAGTGGTQINGADPATFVHVLAWKDRLWFTQKNTGLAWYTDVGAVYGDVTSFNFANKSKMGGYLVGLWNWTLDAGTGIDDHIVAIMSSGDVIIYKGSDPDTAGQFQLVGVWNVGRLPVGRRIATQHGGDLLILSSRGVIPLSTLVSGQDSLIEDKYATRKIQNLFSRLMAERRDESGWSIGIDPHDNVLIITIPPYGSFAGERYQYSITISPPREQIAMHLATKGWTSYTNVPITCATVFRGRYFYGHFETATSIATGYTQDASAVCKLEGDTDYKGATGSGNYIPCGLLSSYQNYGNINHKRVHMIRPRFSNPVQPPAYFAKVHFDFDATELTEDPTYGGFDPRFARWGSAKWDSAKWAGTESWMTRYTGNYGTGANLALELQIKSVTRSTIVGVDLVYDQGGLS